MGEGIVDSIRNIFQKNRAPETANIVGVVDPRVINVDYPKSQYDVLDEATKRELWGGKFGNMVSSQIMNETRFGSILNDINSRFGEKDIGLRGILTSLDGDLSVKIGNEQITVFEIDKLLANGAEQVGVEKINIVPMGKAKIATEIPDRVQQYFINSTRGALGRDAKNMALRDRLFPAIVVYDLGKGSPLEDARREGSAFDYKLPESKEDRARIILGVYPVDVRFTLPDFLPQKGI